MYKKSFFAVMLCLFGVLPSHSETSDLAMQHSVAQLRSSIGVWKVTTEFLNPDGTVAKSVEGSYEFSWVVPDRVVSGKSVIPELKQVAGLLFYVNEKNKIIEMVSVAADGKLWVMTGPLGGEERLSQPFKTEDGGMSQLKFTRYNVAQDTFESKMEYTEDDGKSWQPGNHQTFHRVSDSSKAMGASSP